MLSFGFEWGSMEVDFRSSCSIVIGLPVLMRVGGSITNACSVGDDASDGRKGIDSGEGHIDLRRSTLRYVSVFMATS